MNIRRRVSTGLAIACIAPAALAQAVLVHHVSLSGTIGDQSQERQRITELHLGCVERHRLSGQPIRNPTLPALPTEVTTQRLELYYAADRVVEDRYLSLYELDARQCGIERVERRHKALYSSRGRCEIDYAKNEAKGQCSPGDPPMRPALLVPGLSGARVPTGETRTVAGMACQVYRAGPPYANAVCVSHSANSRFAVPASSLSIGVPGLLLSAESEPAMVNLRATRVSMHESAAADLFAMPPGIRVRRMR